MTKLKRLYIDFNTAADITDKHNPGYWINYLYDANGYSHEIKELDLQQGERVLFVTPENDYLEVEGIVEFKYSPLFRREVWTGYIDSSTLTYPEPPGIEKY